MSRALRAGALFRLLPVAVIASFTQVNADSTGDWPNPYRAIGNCAQLAAGVLCGKAI
jgi:hypothetical protein